MDNRMTAVMVSLVLILGVAAGCSGSASDENADDTKPSRSSTTTSTFVGTGSPTFCPVLREVTKQSDLLAADPSSTEAERKDRWDRAVTTVNQLADQAPAEIEPEAAVVAAVFRTLHEKLARYQYDFTALPQAERDALVTPSVQQAADRLEAYDRQLCSGASTTSST